MTRRQENPKIIFEVLESINEHALTVGFARRFATYKRAHLLFTNMERLSQLVNNTKQPIQFIFAGKAHPQDKAGQDLIKRILEISRRPEFMGKILFIENYDINLAKKLVQGVDIWLNTPTRPLEASGTSGEKAAMNGVINFSVLDGWWAEGYQQNAGWALKEAKTYTNQQFQDELDAEAIYGIFENEIIPAYYYRNEKNIPSRWVDYIKNTFADVVPHFTTRRMMKDYFKRYYIPLSTRLARLKADNFSKAKEIASWKEKVLSVWDQIEVVNVQLADGIVNTYKMGQQYPSQIVLDLKGLSPEEIGVEVIIATGTDHPEYVERHEFTPIKVDNGFTHYSLNLTLTKPGSYNYGVRIFPKNEELPNRQDFRILRWI